MRGTTTLLGDERADQPSVRACPWELTFTPADSYVAVQVNGHRVVSTSPDVIAFMRDLEAVLRHAHWRHPDTIPTDEDLAFAILSAATTHRQPAGDLLPDSS